MSQIFHSLDSLLSPWFLNRWFVWAGLGLILIPIIIHLLNRRRFRQVQWAAMEFLLRAMRKNRRRLKFEQWLLLAVRCLLIALLGAALARPMGCENGALAQFGRQTSLSIFIIDNSYSAGYQSSHGPGKTHLDQARGIVRSLLARANTGGERVSLITCAGPAKSIFGEPVIDMESARQAVDQIEQSAGSTDLRHALEIALDIAHRNEKQPNKNLYILSDATRSAWQGIDAPVLKQLGPELASTFKITHFNLAAGQQQWNGAILGIEPVDAMVTTKFPNEFRAAVQGYFSGVMAGHSASLQWKIDDQPVDRGSTDVRLGESAPPQKLTDVAFATGGPHVLSLRLNDDTDRLPIDNVCHRIVDVASELKVLIVEGKREAGPLGGSGDFIATALAGHREQVPGKPAVSDSAFSPELINDLELSSKILTDYASVILADVGQISPAEADALNRYVRQGGTLLLFMGEAIDRDNYNAMLWKRNRLLPGELIKAMRVGTNEKEYNFEFDPKAAHHPLLRSFDNLQNSGIDRIRTFAYWQVDVPQTSGVEMVLKYQPHGSATGDPAITAQSVGQGRVVFVSTSAEKEWTEFINRPAFLVVLHEMLTGSIKTGDWWMNRTVGQRLSIPSTVRMTSTPLLTQEGSGAAVVVNPPEPEAAGVASDPNKQEKDDWRSLYHTDPLTKPGLYTLSLGDRKIPIAVNPPAQEEADVTTIADAEIPKALGEIKMNLLGAELPVDSPVGKENNDFSWWTMMLVLALACIECALAMRFGHYRRVPESAGATAPAASVASLR